MPRLPDARGHFGPYGGRYVSETLMPALADLERAYHRLRRDARFRRELRDLQREYAGRPTLLYHAERLDRALGGARIWLKREDLCHTGAHKINNTLGQILVARRMRKSRIIAETGAGQHGVATATVAALFGLRCEIYMGSEDIERQALNVVRMRLLGATVHAVEAGSRTLKDAMNEAMRDWVTNVRDTFYIIGSVAGPHPYPEMVRDFQTVIGHETRQQARRAIGRLPDYLVACVGGGSNAIGLFHPFLRDRGVRMIGVEGGGLGIKPGKHAARFQKGGSLGVLQGTRTFVLQDDDGQIMLTHSVSAGLDYAAVTDDEALAALRTLAEREGIIAALESAHAVAAAIRLAPTLPRRTVIVVNLSGRGDKDMGTLAAHMANEESAAAGVARKAAGAAAAGASPGATVDAPVAATRARP